jgi:hypothetical protein
LLHAVSLKLDPADSYYRNEDDKVHNIVVVAVAKCFADYAYEEYQAHCEVLSLNEEINFFHVVGSKEDSIAGLEALQDKKENDFDYCIGPF